MAWPFFETGIASGAILQPNDDYREMQQAFLDQQWDNTTAMYSIQEQAAIGSTTYNDIQVWIDFALGATTRGMANGDDFRKLLFQDITHNLERGRMYSFDDNMWIATFTDEYDSVMKAIIVRRCNNYLRMIDPQSGGVVSFPCAVDYDMASPSAQISNSIITPNNHAVVIVQGNDLSTRLLKTNTRFIIAGRPFKLLGFQNALYDDISTPMSTIMYLDLYLDEIHANDDLVRGIADNGTYDYSIEINSQDLQLTQGSTGTLTATVTLNGQQVSRQVDWNTSNESVVTIDSNGNYTVVGEIGTTANITANIDGNMVNTSTIGLTVVDATVLTPDIVLSPAFNTIRQYESIEFTVGALYNGQSVVPTSSTVSLSQDGVVLSNAYLTIVPNGNTYTLTAKTIASTAQTLYITINNTSPDFTASQTLAVSVTSMMG